MATQLEKLKISTNFSHASHKKLFFKVKTATHHEKLKISTFFYKKLLNFFSRCSLTKIICLFDSSHRDLSNEDSLSARGAIFFLIFTINETFDPFEKIFPPHF